ncbi:fibronectin type III domain-containing protein [Hymenobacter sp. BT664]|uniref:Fibronectin type III domain-containing protein n=1 Tax=Hymenobacter montanus TaxID=2771359 RepID=A0A927BAY5_9BACT|nr:fibronectin type III domain-containing protein [Hymenobacter montanus]MBD2766829.1 fibronectin type III domain-containing protein [Hymenobacter montanus]
MTTSFYACSLKTSGQWRRLTALAVGVLLAPGAWAQIQVPAGNPNEGTSRRPLATYYGYERGALIYTAAEIATSGNLTQIAFYLDAVNTPGAAPTKVYLKTVSNSTFAGATTVAAEETGATLVYDATIPAAAFTANTWITLPLTTPFAYNGTSNLEVIVETNATGGGNEPSTGKAFRYASTGAGNNRAQFWAADNTAPTGTGALSLLRPNIQLTGLAPLTCLPVTALSVSNITPTSAQVGFTPGASNTSYTVTYTRTGGTPTTVTPAPTASPVNLTGLTPGSGYTVTVVGNCGGGGTAPVATTTFTTPLTCGPVTALSVSNITLTSAQVSFTPGNGNTSYTVTYTPAGGTPTTVTPAPTASPVNLTGLTLGTTYTVTVVGNCAGSTTSPVATATFTTASPPPANDDCAGATLLATAATCTPMMATNRGATASTGVPAPSSAAGGCFVANTPVTNDVWYRIVVPASGAFTVTTSAVTGSPLNDTGMTLYTGTCGALTEVACSDDQSASNFFSSTRAVGLTPGATVYVRVWSFGTTPTGPFGICAVSTPNNDAAMRAIYTLGKVPTGVAQAAQAVVTNVGAQALTNVAVTLTVSGATSFTNTQTVATLAPGASTTVSFAPYTSNTAGTNTLTVALAADDVATNNTQTYAQIVTANTFSYVNNTVPDPNESVGFGATTTGAFVARYNTPVARSLTGITAGLGDNNSVGQTVYGVVVNSSGGVLARTPNYVVTAADIDRRKTFVLTTPLPIAAGNFYVGLVQTAVTGGGVRYFPLATLPEDPTRPGTFFGIAPFSPTTGGTLSDAASSNLGAFVLEAETSVISSSSSAALSAALSVYPNPSTGQVTLELREAKAQGPLQVQVTNLLGQVVHTAVVRDNAQNKLDLSGLAEGVYVLRVQTGSQYTIRQLVLTK